MSKWNGIERRTGLKPRLKPIARRTPLKPRTAPLARPTKRIDARSKAPHKAARWERYKQVLGEIFADAPLCQVSGCGAVATDPHHKRGRAGALLYDKRFIIPVCHPCHLKIENEKEWANKMGYRLPRHDKGTNDKS